MSSPALRAQLQLIALRAQLQLSALQSHLPMAMNLSTEVRMIKGVGP